MNNAGIEVAGPLVHLPTDQFQYQLEINLVGPFVVTKAFLPLLGTDPARKGIPGRIVNISSAGGKIAGPFTGAYWASKFGLEGSTTCSSDCLGPLRLRGPRSACSRVDGSRADV